MESFTIPACVWCWLGELKVRIRGESGREEVGAGEEREKKEVEVCKICHSTQFSIVSTTRNGAEDII